jgi:hypothetical protein
MAFDLIDIGEVQRDLNSRTRFLVPNDIDDSGQVLGNMQQSDQIDRPYIFSERQQHWLETGAFGARAMCFIDRDRVVGRDMTGTDEAGFARGLPVIWNRSKRRFLPLPDGLPAPVINSAIASAHPDGRVAGSLSLSNGHRVPVLWTGQQPEILPMLDGFTVCEPKAILDNGIIGGTGSDALGFDYPIYWKDGSVYLLLTGLVTGFIRHHSGSGLTTLFGSVHTGERHEATIWQAGRARIMPELPGAFHESWVESMNRDDIACGTVARSSRRDSWTAVLWEGETVTELASLVELDPNVHLVRATDINDRCQIAAAAVWSDGSLHAVLLEPR